MDLDDQEWINEQQGDSVSESGDSLTGTFEGTVFMSTDGKHTVSIKSDTHAGRRDGMIWAKKIYDRLMIAYGSKQANAAKEYKKVEEDAGLGRCPKCDSPMKMSQKRKPFCSNLCWIK